jgi:hypothetical protein
MITPGFGGSLSASTVVASPFDNESIACAARTALSRCGARRAEVAPMGAAKETPITANSRVRAEKRIFQVVFFNLPLDFLELFFWFFAVILPYVKCCWECCSQTIL